jgi:hypothetical protein
LQTIFPIVLFLRWQWILHPQSITVWRNTSRFMMATFFFADCSDLSANVTAPTRFHLGHPQARSSPV